MYTLSECERLWNDAGQHGTVSERIERSRAWLEYYSYLAKAEHSEPYHFDGKLNPLVGDLLSMGALRLNDRVLDIGAGTGNYTLDMAKYSAGVTALEPCAEALNMLQVKADMRRFKNIDCVNGLWEEFCSEREYDLCFSSMCPAICNADELRRMEKMSTRSCALAAVMRGSYDKHRKAMMSQLGITPKGGMTTEAIHYFNTLYFMGRQPNVKCKTMKINHSTPVNVVMEQYPIYFRIFGVDESVSGPFLEKYLAENACDGYLAEESCIKLAVICWNVNE